MTLKIADHLSSLLLMLGILVRIDSILGHSTHVFISAGFSFGGLLSYEVACQLTQDGEEVAMVTMLDTMAWFPNSFQDNETQFKKFQDFLISDLKGKMVGSNGDNYISKQQKFYSLTKRYNEIQHFDERPLHCLGSE
jgi:surfactin synthase thioesterase subunit